MNKKFLDKIKYLKIGLLSFIAFLCACGPTVQSARMPDWTGQGWYHPNKTHQEVMEDYSECIAESYRSTEFEKREMAEYNCMESRGYTHGYPQH